MHKKQVFEAGKKAGEASKLLILLHGRGGSAEDIIGITGLLNVEGYSIWAPQATNHTWYPFSFMAAPAENEPWLSSAVDLVHGMIGDAQQLGIPINNIFLLGFSQGACLALECAARKARPYGGVVAFTGGLIGDKLYLDNYSGTFEQTPVFLGSGDPDMHVPVERVNESEAQLSAMGAAVTKKIYPRLGHTINQDEIDTVNSIIFKP
ncbi:phospholipase [Chitinophaga caeni]|uniref:Phospholipase n=1 Tax=Chitinophaga caeni TaxID=2029983 RepID=A0A291QPS5_9BACT|nr:dienelactone hydrolase family protein [Chitinophaga caeni]ATL45882.1 phospholipase [Chitinophaga caeni]